MNALKMALPLMLAMLVASPLCAGEGKPKGDRPPGAVGTLSEKPADAKAGVAAVLKTKKGDTINLLAEGELATQLAEAAKKGETVRVTGEKTADGIKVAKFGKPGEGGKKGAGGDKPGDKAGGDKPGEKAGGDKPAEKAAADKPAENAGGK